MEDGVGVRLVVYPLSGSPLGVQSGYYTISDHFLLMKQRIYKCLGFRRQSLPEASASKSILPVKPEAPLC